MLFEPNPKKNKSDKPAPAPVVRETPPPHPYANLLTTHSWKGVAKVAMCTKCNLQGEEDDIKLHVLTHLPENERNAALEYLTRKGK